MGHRSFSLVDHKVAEAEFFLEHLRGCGFNIFAFRCFCSGFVSSARSITFSLQAVLADASGFPDWYSRHQGRLRSDPTARFFHEFRTVNQHIGDNLVGGGVFGRDIGHRYLFTPTQEIPNVPDGDAVEACSVYFTALLEIVYDCYLSFGPIIDAKQRYTAEHFQSLGMSIEDAEEELGYPRGWTDIGDPRATPYRWQVLRDQQAGCEIDHIFEKYLGRVTPRPGRLPPYGET